MRQVGSSRERPMTMQASGVLLAEGARFSESIAHLAPTMFVPKGVYRFHSHDEANRHAQDCLVRGMGLLAAERRSRRAAPDQAAMREGHGGSHHHRRGGRTH